ncbi:MAG: hypothetical protein ACYDAZ_06160 [Thermoplasmataceae archaeon]
MYIDIWNPQYAGLYAALFISFLLGIIHGITPDEHTWPITFSYAVGSYSVKGGAKAGLIFSSGFTLERAVLSELSALLLAGFMLSTLFDGIVYVAIGTVMALSGLYIAKKLRYPHVHQLERFLNRLLHIHHDHGDVEKEELEHEANPIIERSDGTYRAVPLRLAFFHGIIAGFGFGAFALIIYFVMAPQMPWYLGFMPGLLFGLGTMVMQVLAGSLFGKWLSSTKKLTMEGITMVGRGMSSYVLSYGGLAFVIGGFIAILYPPIWSYNLITPVNVHNLHALGLPFFMVVFSVVIIGFIGYRINVKKAMKMGYTRKPET